MPPTQPTTRRALISAVAAATCAGFAGCLGGDGAATTTTTEEPQQTPVALTDAEIRTLDSSCQTEQDERISIEVTTGDGDGDDGDERLRVAGSMQTSTPCYEAVYEGTDVIDRSLRTHIGAEQVGDVCAECVGSVEFELTGRLVGRPDAIEVVLPNASAAWERANEESE